MGTGIFGVGVSGMQAAQLGLLTTEHNIANASTAGYNRQRTIQSSNIPIMTGAGSVGQGAHVSTIERMYSEFLSGQVNTSQTNVSELDSYYTQIKQIDNMLADPNSGLSPAMQDFFSGVQQVASNPSSLPSRQAMISSAEAMVARFHSIEDRLAGMADGINTQVVDIVGTINSYAQQIGNLNERILVAQASSNQPANDLLDQRDNLVGELNKLIKVNTSTNGDGTYNVFIGTGQQLVVGLQVSTMTATASVADSSRIVVGLQTAGRVQEMPENLITGGQLGGLIRFRSESLDRAFNEMGRVAASLASTFNAQNSLGQDLLGNSAGSSDFVANFFNMQNMQPTVLKNANNAGDAVIRATFVSPPPVTGAYTLTNNGSYVLTRLSDGHTWTGGDPASLVDSDGNGVPASEGLDLTSVTVASGDVAMVYSPKATTGNFFTSLTVSDYRLAYDGTNYTMTRLSDQKQWTDVSLANLSTTIGGSEGFNLALASGTMANGDSMLIQPTRAASRNISVNTSVANDPRLIAAAAPVRTGVVLTNTGTGSISNGQSLSGYSNTSPALGSTLVFNAGNLSGFPDGAVISVTPPGGIATVYTAPAVVPYVAGADISFAGVSFKISGKPNDGDQFTISANTGNAGIADARNAVMLGKLQQQATVAGGSANYQAAYSQFVSAVGNKTRETQVTGDAQKALLEQAQGSREAMSGVNLDEEAANLLHFQQAYQAAAKMLEIGTKLFDTILSLR